MPDSFSVKEKEGKVDSVIAQVSDRLWVHCMAKWHSTNLI